MKDTVEEVQRSHHGEIDVNNLVNMGRNTTPRSRPDEVSMPPLADTARKFSLVCCECQSGTCILTEVPLDDNRREWWKHPLGARAPTNYVFDSKYNAIWNWNLATKTIFFHPRATDGQMCMKSERKRRGGGTATKERFKECWKPVLQRFSNHCTKGMSAVAFVTPRIAALFICQCFQCRSTERKRKSQKASASPSNWSRPPSKCISQMTFSVEQMSMLVAVMRIENGGRARNRG